MAGKRLFGILAVLLAAAVLAAGCGGGRQEKAAAGAGGGKITVYTTVFPIYDFARNVGGERVEIVNLLPPGADPHHWEPTPGDLARIGRAHVFAYCGAGLEAWAKNALKSVDRDKTAVVDCSRGIELLEAENGGSGGGSAGNESHGASGGNGHGHGLTDPHVWLDPANAGIMVDNILAGLTRADPAGRDYYTANAAAYKDRLDRLDGRYREALAGAGVKQFVVSHAAFGYLARRYGLEQVTVRGLTADGEPGPARMAEIVDLIRRQKIKYVFFESLTSPRVSEAIAREAGAGILPLHPIAALTGKEWEEGKSYLSLMEENLENLKQACQAR